MGFMHKDASPQQCNANGITHRLSFSVVYLAIMGNQCYGESIV